MIRVKENARGSSVEVAATALGTVLAKYDGWTRPGDIVVTKRRTGGSTVYEASAWLVRAE